MNPQDAATAYTLMLYRGAQTYKKCSKKERFTGARSVKRNKRQPEGNEWFFDCPISHYLSALMAGKVLSRTIFDPDKWPNVHHNADSE
ncbi:hypothetical protein RE428_19500 [Marinobacter nanhaiticus D15-8W]|nr:hypothetical protein RE428_19500 [Marinobacter nanhaiticus D15-8W]